MGHIRIRFFSNGINLENDPTSVKWGKVQSLQREYSTSKMQEIEVTNDDFYFDFDIDQISGGIDWDNLNYPNGIIKGKIREIMYYGQKSNQLERILEEIKKCRFEDSYTLQSLGRDAINVIKDVADSIFLSLLSLHQDEAVSNIEYTLVREVERLRHYTKNSSNKNRNEALNDAKRHLTNDIIDFKVRLDSVDVNRNK